MRLLGTRVASLTEGDALQTSLFYAYIADVVRVQYPLKLAFMLVTVG